MKNQKQSILYGSPKGTNIKQEWKIQIFEKFLQSSFRIQH